MNMTGLAAVNTAATGTPASTANSTTANPASDTKSMFLQLLVAQLQNQSPLDPVDPTQFTSQLVQFNMLDQLSQINQTLQNTFGSTLPPTTSPSKSANQTVQGASNA
jgi:flagellar basal-body rod modification protein FlgD